MGITVGGPVTTGELPEAVALLGGEIDGLLTSFVTAATVRVAAGVCRDSTNTDNVAVAAPVTADITASGANGLDTGAEAASTWYAIYVIAGPGQPIAALLSASFSSPTLPTGYTVFRRVGAVRNDSSSNLVEFFMTGNGRSRPVLLDRIINSEPISVLAGGSATVFTAVDLSGALPPTSETAQLRLFQGGSIAVRVRPSGVAGITGLWDINAGDHELVSRAYAPGQSIDYKNDAAGGALDIACYGYVDEL